MKGRQKSGRISKKKGMLFFVLLYLLVSICMIWFSIRVSTPRNPDHEDILQLDADDKYIRQKMFLSNTDEIRFTLLGEYGTANEADVVIEIEELRTGNKIQKRMPLTDLPNQEWHEVSVSDPGMKKIKGDVEATIRVEGGDEKHHLKILLIHAKQSSVFPVHMGVVVNGEEYSGQYIFVSYECFYAGTVIAYLVILLIIMTAAVSILSKMNLKKAGRWSANHFLTVFGAVVLIWKFWEADVFHMDLNPWSYEIYLMNYDYGFIPQALPGTVIKILSGYFSAETYKMTAVFLMVIVFAIESIFFFQGKDE